MFQSGDSAPDWGDRKAAIDGIGERILGCALKVHRTLGPGLLEAAYEACLAHEIEKCGLDTKRQMASPLVYDGLTLDVGYRLDLLVAGRVVVEIKAVESLAPVHRAQLLSYLRLGGYPLGYLINFNVVLLKDGICRLANRL